MIATKPLLGNGIYEPAEAARLLHVPARRVHRWLFGIDDSSGGKNRTLHPVCEPCFEINTRNYITFEGLIEILAIDAFRQLGVSMSIIRSAHERARKRYEVEFPFSSRPFFTDGTSIFAELRDDDSTTPIGDDIGKLEELARGQLAFERIIRPSLKNIDFDRETARRYWPLGHEKSVVLDAERNFGKPIVDHHAIPTIALYNAFRAEGEISLVARWYQVDEISVENAIAYERSIERAA